MNIPLHFVITLDIILPKAEQEHPTCLSAANSISLARTSA
jgi:hypothetical protein